MLKRIRWPQRPKKGPQNYLSAPDSETYSTPDDDSTISRSRSLLPSPGSRGGDRSRSGNRRAEPQGLNIIYEPTEARIADIIFVHGLGGSTITTWTKDGDTNTFWPEKFLPAEPGLSRARMLSFGYTAFFTSPNVSKRINITDFARSLLANLQSGAGIGIGQVPIIFVAHSLGGLVVKKAYTMGRANDHLKNIMLSVSAIVFLGTPHHGSNLARSLNALLTVSNPKQYVADLAQASPMIEDINEQFRHFVDEIRIASFYESRYTSIGLKKMIIVEKQSAILGCSSEVAQPLDADHHELCKFTDTNDSNYQMVKNTLTSFLPSLRDRRISTFEPSTQDSQKLSVLLAITEAPEADLNFYSDRRMPETCSWILSDPRYLSWRDSTTAGNTLWINGPAGSGKSILTSFLINHLRTDDIICTYYFFRSGDKSQLSASTFLRSIAFQIAQRNSEYKRMLEELSDAGTRFEKTELKLLWQKLSTPLSACLDALEPICVIVDGLDESDAPQALLNLLSQITDIPWRFVFVSRLSSALSSAFDKYSQSRPVAQISADSNRKDIPAFVENELRMMHGDENLREDVTREIIERASGNFLWVHLVIQEILDCHTQGEIKQILDTLPSGMQPLYERIEDGMVKSLKPMDRKLARTLLSWATCAQRPLGLEELTEAIEPGFPHIIDLKHTIGYICGNLLVVDRTSRVLLIHKTAREYLTKVSTGPFAIVPARAHSELLLRCMSSLCDPRSRSQRGPPNRPALLTYAARSWPFHLQAHSGGPESLAALMSFLKGTSVLSWIQFLSAHDQLYVLVQSSRALSMFIEKRRGLDSSLAPNLRPIQDLETLDLWTTDLLKIVGKFGHNLLKTPDSIFKFIPPFCPTGSVIHRQFGRRSPLSVCLSRSSNASWDDSLAKLFVGTGSQALQIICAGKYFAILTTLDSVILWNAATCQKTNELSHGEHVTDICASNTGKLIATHGFQTTKIWDMSAGKPIMSFPNPGQGKALDFIFAKNDTEIWMASDDRKFWWVPLSDSHKGWQEFGPDLFGAAAALPGTLLNSPSSIAFSPDGSQVAVAFRGAPLTVWSVNDSELIARCRRDRDDQGKSDARPWTSADTILWHPQSGEVIGIYQDSTVFRWHPLESSSEDLGIQASAMDCSPDGDLFVASDMHGTIRIWKYHDFVLIYQLRCEYLVTSLAFSPDNRRIYDLRGSFCNVWEPNTLIRLSELESPGSESRSESGFTVSSINLSEAEVENVEPVSALAVSPKGDIYCIGNTEGIVVAIDHQGYEIGNLWKSPSFMPIENIIWGANGSRVAFRDLGDKVVVQDLEFHHHALERTEISSRTVFSATIKYECEPMKQILMNPQSDKILIASQNSAQIWSVQSAKCLARWHHEDSRAVVKWLNHPLKPTHLLAVEAKKASSHSWQDLTLEKTFSFDDPSPRETFQRQKTPDRIRKPALPRSLSSECFEAEIERAVSTQDGLHIMIETSRFAHGQNASERQLMFVGNDDLDRAETFLVPQTIPAVLHDQVQLPLGVLPEGKLIFLDNENWLCSWRLKAESGMADVHRHFFLPREWLNAEGIELCQVTQNGALVIPKGGDVAFIRSDLGVQWS